MSIKGTNLTLVTDEFTSYAKNGNPPSGGGEDGMEARVARLEASVEHIERDISEIKTDIRGLRSDAKVDFRTIFAAIITVALGLAAIMAKGFHWF